MPNDGNAMVPGTNWHETVRGFAAGQARQVILCVTCVRDGNTDPPATVIIVGGWSYCDIHCPHIGAT